MSAQTLINDFNIWLVRHQKLAPLTQKTYTTALAFFFQFLKMHRVAEVDLDLLLQISLSDVRSFLSYRWAKGIQIQSQAVMLAAIKSFYRFLMSQGQAPVLPIHLLRRPKLSHRLARPLTKENIQKLLHNRPDQTDWIQWRNYSLMILLYATGMRIQEALSLNQKDKKEVLYIKGKRNKERVVPLLQVATGALDRYLVLCPHVRQQPHEPLFWGQKGGRLQAAIFQKYVSCQRSALSLPPHVTPHSLRHSFASHLLEDGAPIRDVQELLGHACLTSTQHYMKTTRGRMYDVYCALHPRASAQEDS